MAMAERRAEAVWHGNLTQGSGEVTVGSGALPTMPVTWAARTEQPGGKTSPEELIAAAHAACYAMAFSNTLNTAGTPPEQLTVTAVCTLDRVEGGVKITHMELTVRGRVPGLDAAGFESAALEAEHGCPVSNALRGNVQVHLTARLE
jgi:osmotically inducible protein OsmC